MYTIKMEIKNYCAICGKMEIKNYCSVCSMLFISSVKNRSTPRCSNEGKCTSSAKRLKNCDFCRLNNCYDFGLKSEQVVGFDIHSVVDINEIKPLAINFDLDGSIKRSMLIFEQQFQNWINSILEKFDLSNQMINLKNDYIERGIIMGFVQRSLNTHHVIRLHDCFIKWNSPDCRFLRKFFYWVLHFVNSVSCFLNYDEEFFSLMMRLILDANITFDEPVSDHFQYRFKKMEKWFRRYLINDMGTCEKSCYKHNSVIKRPRN